MRLLIILLLSINTVFAECDWKTIERSGDKFIYSTDCHKQVGRLVLLNDKNEEEIALLRKSLELKDLALQDADKRIIIWKDEAYKQYDFVKKQGQSNTWEKIGWVGVGFFSVLAGAWAVGQVK